MRLLKILILLTFAFFITAGCRRGILTPPDLPKLTPCTISVTQEGLPLEGASILLILPGEGQRWFPGGQTEADGTARIRTNGRYDGAPSGTYKIQIVKQESEQSKLPPPPPEDDPAYPAWLKLSESENLDTFLLVEERYMNPNATPHQIEIINGKPMSFVFDVGKKIRIKMP